VENTVDIVGFEVITAVTLKKTASFTVDIVFVNIKTCPVLMYYLTIRMKKLRNRDVL
jgi:hypothetical protein